MTKEIRVIDWAIHVFFLYHLEVNYCGDHIEIGPKWWGKSFW